MTTRILTSRSFERANAHNSSTSSDVSSKNNKERMLSFKGLSTKKNTVMEHLLHFQDDKDSKAQSSPIIGEEQQGFKPRTERKMDKELTSSFKLAKDNPFQRARQNCLNKGSTTSGVHLTAESKEEHKDDCWADESMTTFKMLKKGSLNMHLSKINIAQS